MIGCLNAGPNKELLRTMYKELKVTPTVMFIHIEKTIQEKRKSYYDNDHRLWYEVIMANIPPMILHNVDTEKVMVAAKHLQHQLFARNGQEFEMPAEAQWEKLYGEIYWILVGARQSDNNQ
jgi:hypothetical protein